MNGMSLIGLHRHLTHPAIKQETNLSLDYFPETLSRVHIINAPFGTQASDGGCSTRDAVVTGVSYPLLAFCTLVARPGLAARVLVCIITISYAAHRFPSTQPIWNVVKFILPPKTRGKFNILVRLRPGHKSLTNPPRIVAPSIAVSLCDKRTSFHDVSPMASETTPTSRVTPPRATTTRASCAVLWGRRTCRGAMGAPSTGSGAPSGHCQNGAP